MPLVILIGVEFGLIIATIIMPPFHVQFSKNLNVYLCVGYVLIVMKLFITDCKICASLDKRLGIFPSK